MEKEKKLFLTSSKVAEVIRNRECIYVYAPTANQKAIINDMLFDNGIKYNNPLNSDYCVFRLNQYGVDSVGKDKNEFLEQVEQPLYYVRNTYQIVPTEIKLYTFQNDKCYRLFITLNQYYYQLNDSPWHSTWFYWSSPDRSPVVILFPDGKLKITNQELLPLFKYKPELLTIEQILPPTEKLYYYNNTIAVINSYAGENSVVSYTQYNNTQIYSLTGEFSGFRYIRNKNAIKSDLHFNKNDLCRFENKTAKIISWNKYISKISYLSDIYEYERPDMIYTIPSKKLYKSDAEFNVFHELGSGSLFKTENKIYEVIENLDGFYIKTNNIQTGNTKKFRCYNYNTDDVILIDKKISDIRISPEPKYSQDILDNTDCLVDKAYEVITDWGGYYSAKKLPIRYMINTWNRNKCNLYDLLSKHPKWNEKTLSVEEDIILQEPTSANKISDAVSNLYWWLRNNGARFTNLCELRGAYDGVNEEVKAFADQVNAEYGLKIKCNLGMKFSRFIRSCADQIGWKDITGFETEYARFSDVFSTRPIKYTWRLSINPVDYLMMSNGRSWHSCHQLQANNRDRCYQNGTLSYMMDGVSMVFSLITPTDNYSPEEPKVYRQMWFYQDGFAMSSRMYPQSNDSRPFMKNAVKEWVLNAIFGKSSKQLYSEDYFWEETENKEKKYIRLFEINEYATLYPDFNYRNYGCVLYADETNQYDIQKTIYIGQTPLCVHCGYENTENDNLLCGSCYEEDYEEDSDEEYEED